MRPLNDSTIVQVGGDLNKAIKILKLRLAAAGTFRQLKDRVDNLTSAGRKKSKRLRAERRRWKKEVQGHARVK